MNVPNRHGDFEIASGSVIGSAHARAGRNNQDAVAWARTQAGLVAVVCDGCSSAPHSEVGAGIVARLFTQSAARWLDAGVDARTALAHVRDDVLARMRVLAMAMSREGSFAGTNALGSFRKTVADHFLSTVVGVVVDSTTVTTFAAGDGLVAINGERRPLGPFVDNAPPYLAYELVGIGAGAVDIHPSVPREGVDSLVIGTDGANDLPPASLEQLCADDLVYRNSDMIRRRLTVLSRGGARLVDDTSVVFLRRAKERAP